MGAGGGHGAPPDDRGAEGKVENRNLATRMETKITDFKSQRCEIPSFLRDFVLCPAVLPPRSSVDVADPSQ